MGKIDQNKERKRSAILSAAQKAFLSEGYQQSSMDRIAAQAQVTKQTVYRYYPSKIDLFEATLTEMGKGIEEEFLSQLNKSDTREALLGFARDFIRFHVSERHIATFRLLVSESANAPEITRHFFAIAPDRTTDMLSSFFSEKFNIKDVQSIISLWTGMLLEPRSGVLVGMTKPTRQHIDRHAKNATDFLFAALR